MITEADLCNVQDWMMREFAKLFDMLDDPPPDPPEDEGEDAPRPTVVLVLLD